MTQSELAKIKPLFDSLNYMDHELGLGIIMMDKRWNKQQKLETISEIYYSTGTLHSSTIIKMLGIDGIREIGFIWIQNHAEAYNMLIKNDNMS